MTVGLETKYDILVSKALQFLTSVASTQHAENFNNQTVLVQVIEKHLNEFLSFGQIALQQGDNSHASGLED